MYIPIKQLLLGLFILLSIGSITSQTRTYSPFSRYGLGEINDRGYGINNALGGAGIGLRTDRGLNYFNPASHSAIDSMSFYLDVGLSSHSQALKMESGSQNFSNIDFDHFAFGFPISKKLGVSIGFKPVAQAGYEYQEINTNSSIKTSIGAGNITSLYGGFGYQIMPQLSIGVNAAFWFGDIYHKNYVGFLDNANGQTYGIKNEHTARTLVFDFGAQYTVNLSDEKSIVFGATFTPEIHSTGKSSTLTANGRVPGIDSQLFLENQIISADTVKWNDVNFKLPSKIGVGFSYNIKDKLTLAADYSLAKWGAVDFTDEVTKTEDATKFALGAEWIPNERTGVKYRQRVRYRAGVHYANEYLKFDDNQLKNYGFSVGLGLPLRRSKTSVNISYEYGNRGTFKSGAVKEIYQNVSFSITMHEFWFRKLKFN